MGQDFLGCYDLLHDRLVLIDRGRSDVVAEGEVVPGARRSRSSTSCCPAGAVAKLREEVEMARGLCPPFDLEAYREGHLTPVFFGSALNNFGVARAARRRSPSWRRRRARSRPRRARSSRTRSKVTGFVFKIQANMDPKHRDRIAFVRLCSGRFERGMKLHARALRQDDRRPQPGALPGAATASWPRRPGRATSSASRTTATCASATR